MACVYVCGQQSHGPRIIIPVCARAYVDDGAGIRHHRSIALVKIVGETELVGWLVALLRGCVAAGSSCGKSAPSVTTTPALFYLCVLLACGAKRSPGMMTTGTTSRDEVRAVECFRWVRTVRPLSVRLSVRPRPSLRCVVGALELSFDASRCACGVESKSPPQQLA